MKASFLKLSLAAVAIAALCPACKDDEAYPTSVTREIAMTLDGEPWNYYYATNNYPIYIYNTNGDFYANYNASFRFSLPDGAYRVFATNQSKLIVPPANLFEQVIEQDPEAKQTFAISAPIDYRAGDKLDLSLHTRTGQLYLHATDVKADKSYSIIRTIIKTPVQAYSIGEAAPISGEDIEIVRHKETSGGGVGFTESMYLIGSENDKFNITIEYLDADSNVVKTKDFADSFSVLPNQQTQVDFQLNNPDEPVIINYNVSIGQLVWRENDIFPSVKVDVPDGFHYIEPSADINSTLRDLLADDSVDKVKIFLKAGASYSISDKVIEDIKKPLIILGQTPGFGQQTATLSLYNVSMQGNIDEIRFENLTLVPRRDRIFNLRNQEFNVGTIAFVGCTINSWTGVIWTSAVTADNKQTVGNVVMDGCRLTNITTSTPLWNPNSRRIAPIYNWTFRNTLFHGRNFGTSRSILQGLGKMPGNLTLTVEGCTFLDSRGTNCTYFDIDGAAAQSLTVNVKGNTVAGTKSDVGTWFKFGKTSSINASGNIRAKGYNMKAWGVDTPAESDKTYAEIVSQNNL